MRSLETALAETDAWIRLRRMLTEALSHSQDHALTRFLKHNWPENGVPRQTEVVALERQILELETEIRRHRGEDS